MVLDIFDDFLAKSERVLTGKRRDEMAERITDFLYRIFGETEQFKNLHFYNKTWLNTSVFTAENQ